LIVVFCFHPYLRLAIQHYSHLEMETDSPMLCPVELQQLLNN